MGDLLELLIGWALGPLVFLAFFVCAFWHPLQPTFVRIMEWVSNL